MKLTIDTEEPLNELDIEILKAVVTRESKRVKYELKSITVTDEETGEVTSVEPVEEPEPEEKAPPKKRTARKKAEPKPSVKTEIEEANEEGPEPEDDDTPEPKDIVHDVAVPKATALRAKYGTRGIKVIRAALSEVDCSKVSSLTKRKAPKFIKYLEENTPEDED